MTGDPITRELTRRRFLGAGALTLTQALALTRAAAAAVPRSAPALVPTDAAVRASIAAYVDTIVPGPAGGGDSAPGAIEAGALDVVYDPAYGANAVLPWLHEDLQLSAQQMLGRAFALDVPYADRERVVVERMKSTGRYGAQGDAPSILFYAGVAIIAYVAYYGTARSTTGPQYIGFPTTSDGYRHHSYRVRFAGMTKDGNPR